jgi:asparagine synthase (glutamine-hydrolysing)
MDKSVARKALTAMTNAQCHRGPDDSGETAIAVSPSGRWLGLGQRRLSIIDLSPAGHQPMVHPGTGDQIIFNGEIYNFEYLRKDLVAAGENSFRGHSDTEVLLYGLSRWGPDFVRRLQGMFAFAFYDARRRTLLLARDSVGIKPLYTAEVGGNLLFASEVRALLASGMVSRRIDPMGLAGVLAYGCPQQPRTICAEIRSFPSGCYQLIDLASEARTPKPTAYWRYPDRPANIDSSQLISSVESTLDAAVRDHLVADVPVGVFLSSGLDSTVIAGLAARHATDLRSFCVGFADQPDLSEQTLAKETARLFGLKHTEITVNNQDAEQAALEWMQSLDQPSVDGLNVYIISKAVRAEGITVALSGQGGDELFGGYSSFTDVPRLAAMTRRLAWLPRGPRGAIAGVAAMGRSDAVRQKLMDMFRTDGSILSLYLQRRRAMSDRQLSELGIDAEALGLNSGFEPPEAVMDLGNLEEDPVFAISQLESRFYQANMLLRDGDANGMAHSLEIRVPILDQRMLDLVLPVPGKIKLPAGSGTKHLMRVAFAPLLRPALLRQGKRGFTLPIRRWMLGPLRDLCEHGLVSLKQTGILRPEGIDAVWQTFLQNPESPAWSRAFTLCTVGLYAKRIGLTA